MTRLGTGGRAAAPLGPHGRIAVRRGIPAAVLALTLLPAGVGAPGLGPGDSRAASGRTPLELSFYSTADLRSDAALPGLERVWRRAAACGYTKVMFVDVHFARPDLVDVAYRRRVARLRTLADSLRLAIVPGVFQIGRSNVMLGRDPNLAEGVPVRGALFVVRGGEAHLVADPPVALGARPAQADRDVRVADGVAATENTPGPARFRFRVRVAPFRCYHVAVRVRSRGFSGTAYVNAVGGAQPLDYIRPLDIRPEQDWTPYDVVFNSLDHRDVVVFMGVWKASRGRLEWRDWRIEEVGPLNVLRRAGAPLTIEGGVEGRDVESIRDPALDAARTGEFSVWHAPPAIRTRLADGTRLRISWFAPAFFYGAKTTACPSDPGTMRLLGEEAARMKELWSPSAYLMMHDEIRCLGWDPACGAAGAAAGAVLAAHLRHCRELLAGAQVYAWSDMVDPFQNAHDGYYLVHGNLHGSWEGLARDVIIVNWDMARPAQSLRFFAGRGHRQILAGYYDGDPKAIGSWLAAARGVPGIIGVMYTTWQGRYDDLEVFAKNVRSTESQPAGSFGGPSR